MLELGDQDPVFRFHFPRRPVLPASTLLECFAQTGTILLEASHGFTRKALPGYVSDAKFYRMVRPGAEVRVELTAEQWSADAAVLRARAEQDGVKCAAATLGMLTAPLSEFYGPEHLPAYRAMYERWLSQATLEGFYPHPLESLSHACAG